MIKRKRTKEVKIGKVGVGGDNPVRVQSMTNTPTNDVKATVDQIKRLEEVGCEIIRVAVFDKESALAIEEIKKRIEIPIVADVHFDYKLALISMDCGVDGLRINPGNIGSERKIKKVVEKAKELSIPIRIGVNSGSVEKEILKKHQGPTPEALVESAVKNIKILESFDFFDIKISIKSSSPIDTIVAYKLLSETVDYPLHIGITEAGFGYRGIVKSSVGLGILLFLGIGDTLRVSLTGDPVEEVLVAWEILRALGIRARGPEIISCPTCARTEIDVIRISKHIEEYLKGCEDVFTVAVMGCPVNGPGEAKEADIGLAGGKNMGVIFKGGKVVKKIKDLSNLLEEFKKELSSFVFEKFKKRIGV